MFKKLAKYGGVGALLSAGAAHAAGTVDVTAATTYLSGEATTNIAAVGVAIITLAAIAMGISWVKATFFG